MAKQFMSERNAAPSLCMSMKISPSCPLPYSPVRRKILCPPTFASCVKPWRFFGSRTRVPVGSVGGDAAGVGARLMAGIESGGSSTVMLLGATFGAPACADAESAPFSLLDVERGCDALHPSR